jgi:putative ABC transport system permease protein
MSTTTRSAARAPATPPDRRPTWPRWLPAFRLALRDAWGARGRSALVVGLVALPVSLVAGVALTSSSRASAAGGQEAVASGELSDGVVLGIAVGLLQIVLLAGAAFAVSVRRRQREMALLAAAGAEPGDLTRAVMAEAILLGGLGAALGCAGPWLALVVGRPVLQDVTGWQLAAFPPIPLALVLVPILGLLACVLACLPAARAAARIPVAQALRAAGGGTAPVGLGRTGAARSRRWALLGLVMLAAGVAAVARYVDTASALADVEGAGRGGAGWLALGLVLSQGGVVLLSPALLVLVTRPRWLPVAARVAARDAARNGLRSAFAVAAVAAATGLAAAALVWTGSVLEVARAGHVAALPEGVVIIGADATPPGPEDAWWAEQETWRTLTGVDRLRVAEALPGAQVALVAVAGLRDPGSPDGLAVRSRCDPVASLGVPGEVLRNDPGRGLAVTQSLPAGSGCLVPEAAGTFLRPSATAGLRWSQDPGVLVVGPSDAALVLGRDDPAVRAALAAGSAVALTPRAVASGTVRLQQTAVSLPEPRTLPSAEVPAVVVEGVGVRPAAVLVAPEVLAGVGLGAAPNALVVRGAQGRPVPAGFEVRGEGTHDVPLGEVTGTGLFVSLDLPREPRDLLGVWGALLFALGATVLVTSLAIAEARGDLAVMAAVGASPRLRRRFAACSAAVVALVGTLLGVVGGLAPAWAALSAVSVLTDPDRCLWLAEPRYPWDGISCHVPVAVPLAIPWGWLAALVAVVPLVAAAVQYLATVPRRPPAGR